MSEETLRVVQTVAEVIQAEDLVAAIADQAVRERFLEHLGDLVEPEFETVFIAPPHLGSAQRSYRGPQGFLDGWLDWTEPYSSYRVEVRDVTEGPEGIVVVAHQTGETRTGGVEIEQDASSVWRVRDNKLSRVEFHLDHDSALKAAGLA